MTAVARAGTVNRSAFPYRMKDLCDRTGIPRQAIHFYIQQGLLPEGEKTGRNMAYYGEAHLERLKLIKQLQHERFLPLRAIRAVLDEEDDGFTKPQRRFFTDVKHRLGPLYAATAMSEGESFVPLLPLLARAGVSREDADAFARIGILHVTQKRGRPQIAKEDTWMIDLWGEVRASGFTEALGFVPEDVTLFAQALETVFAKERVMLRERLAHLPPAEVARMVESAVPILNQFFARYHESLVRKFFASFHP
jgi:DNA-binding transcriptional MerR regulator